MAKKTQVATTAKSPVTPAADVKRVIRKTPEQRMQKIAAYLQAAVYNAKKVGNAKLAATIDAVLKSPALK